MIGRIRLHKLLTNYCTKNGIEKLMSFQVPDMIRAQLSVEFGNTVVSKIDTEYIYLLFVDSELTRERYKEVDFYSHQRFPITLCWHAQDSAWDIVYNETLRRPRGHRKQNELIIDNAKQKFILDEHHQRFDDTDDDSSASVEVEKKHDKSV